jgi:predicted RNA methylase
MELEQKTGLNRNTVDKYYTKKETVDLCVSLLSHIQKSDIIIEPSAGNGAFIKQLMLLSNNCLFYDLLPEHPQIIKQDFMSLKPNITADKIHVVGNPPFGRQSSMAIKFIQKSCDFADSVAFILPRSFKKQSMKNKFEPHFHLIKEIDVPRNSFLVNNNEFDVPCVFQVWLKKVEPRQKIKKQIPVNFTFVKKEEDPTISFRRVGVNAGVISYDIINKSIQSHYFIKLDRNKVDLLKKIIYEENNTVGPKSVSKQELILQFNKILS